MTRLELANQLIEIQSAFHFAFIPMRSKWYRRRDSNPHYLVSKTSASFQLGYAGMVNPAGLEPATCRFEDDCSNSTELRVRKMVDLVRLERTTSTFAVSRSDSTELQVQVGGRDRTRTCKRQRAVVFGTTALPVRLPFHDFEIHL